MQAPKSERYWTIPSDNAPRLSEQAPDPRRLVADPKATDSQADRYRAWVGLKAEHGQTVNLDAFEGEYSPGHAVRRSDLPIHDDKGRELYDDATRKPEEARSPAEVASAEADERARFNALVDAMVRIHGCYWDGEEPDPADLELENEFNDPKWDARRREWAGDRSDPVGDEYDRRERIEFEMFEADEERAKEEARRARRFDCLHEEPNDLCDGRPSDAAEPYLSTDWRVPHGWTV